MKKMVVILLYTLSSIWAYPASGLEEQQAACTGAHQEWDSRLNRCMTTQEAVDMKSNTEACDGAADPQACYMKVAEEKTGVKEGDELKSSNIEMVAKVVAGAYALFSFIAGSAAFARYSGATKGKSCKSKTIFQLTSVAWIGGDLFLKHRAKKSFEKMADDYKNEQGNKDLKGSADSSFQSQVRAFTYLRQEQEQIKDQASQRSKLQMAAALGFGLSAGFAVYEMMNPTAACSNKEEKKDPFEDDKNTELQAKGKPDPKPSPLNDPNNPELMAKGGGPKTVMTQAQGNLDAESLGFGKIMSKLTTSPMIFAGASVMGVLNLYLIKQANQEKKRAESNIKAIDEALDTYSQFMAGFCPDGREDINNDRCYCYNPDGSKNDNRTKSVICQNLFAADDMNYALRTEKIKPIDEGPRQGCITVTGQFDVDCKCQKMINSTSKQNACMNTPSSALLSGGFGAKLDAPNTISTMGSLGNGANKALGSLNGDSLASKVARNKKLLSSLTAQAKSKNPDIKGDKEVEGIVEGILSRNDNPNAVSQLNNAFRPTGRNLGSVPAGLEEALKKAEAKASIDKGSNFGVAKVGKGGVGPKGAGNDFKFKWNDAAAREGNQVKNFMGKDYDYKGSDIVDREDVSLWNVISKRYQTSGLKRLFGDEEEE